MKSENLFTRVVAWLLCAMLVIGYLPAAPIVANAASDQWETPIDPADPPETTAPPAGSTAENPIDLTADLLYEGDLTATVTVPAGATYYYLAYRVGGMIMSINGGEGVPCVTNGMMYPYNFTITNDGAADAEYVITVNYPEGTQYNPMDLDVGENVVSLEAGNQGYFYDFQNESNGYVTFTIYTYGDYGWQWQINNVTGSLGGDRYTSDDEAYVYTQTFKYNAGDLYELMVNTYDSENKYVAPEGTVCVEVSFKAGWGTEELPFVLTEYENYTMSVAPGETAYYQGYFSGMNMTVSGNEGFVVTYNGEEYTADTEGNFTPVAVNSGDPRVPVTFAITNNSEEEASYYIGFAYPEGTVNNPKDLWMNETASYTFAEGENSYYYDFVEYTNGYVTFIITADAGWMYKIDNITAEIKGEYCWSDDEPAVTTQTFKYNAGDEYVLEVATFDPESDANPAGTVNVEVIFVSGWGTEDAPYQLNALENTVTIADGDPVYYTGRFAGMNMTVAGTGDFSVILDGKTYAAVNGAVTINNLPGDNNWMPPVFAIDGNGEFTITFAFPAGHMQNPAVAEIGDNAANIAAGSQGYYFTYTAEKAGDLIVTISGAANWTYAINNMTTGVYGDTQWSDSDPVVNPATIKVAAGDEIEIIVNSYDPENRWEAPAANLNVNLKYKEVILPSGNATLKWGAITMMLESDMTVIFKVKPEVFAAGAYTDLRVEFAIPDVLDGSIRSFTIKQEDAEIEQSTGRLVFRFTGISPRMMKAPITANLFGTYEGVEACFEYTYYVSNYCYNQLDKTSNANKKNLLTLLVDLLNYGTAHQLNAGHDVENLINAELTDAQKAYASNYALELTSIQNGKHEVIDNPEATWSGISLYLGNAVFPRYKITLADTTDAYVKFTIDGAEHIIPASEWVNLGNNVYQVDFTKAMAKQMSSAIDAVVCRDGVAIGNTFRYSIESYAQRNITKPALTNILTYLMYYGNSTARYFANPNG